MAELDQLNFRVLINDTEFNAKCAAMEQRAQQLNVALSRLLSMSAAVSGSELNTTKQANKLHLENVKAREQEAVAIAKSVAKQRELNAISDSKIAAANAKAREQEAREIMKTEAAQQRLNNATSRQSGLMLQLRNLAFSYFSIIGASRIVSNMVRVSAEFEMQRRTLQYIIQDSYKGLKLFNEIKDLALVSPFTFKELMTYTKQLSAFSVPKSELFETTKMLADVSAGLGVSMDRLILAYGQIRSASFLRGQEVRQLTEAGVPILEDLRRQFVELGEEGITVGDVFDKISKRMVPFEMVAKVFKDMTSEGGKFYNMQEVQAETLQGKISNLKDAYQIMFAEIGERGDSILKGSVDMLRSFADNWESIGQSIVRLTATFGTFYATMTLFRISDYIVQVGGLTKAIQSLTVVQRALNVVVSANPYAIAATAVAGLAVAIYQLYNNSRELNREIGKLSFDRLTEMGKSLDRFEKLSDSLRKATRGSQNYRDAISKLNREYGKYLPNILTEADAVERLADAYDLVTESIRNRAKAEAEDLARDKVNDIYSEARDNYAASAMRRMIERGVSPEVATKVWAEFSKVLQQKIAEGSTDYTIDTFNDVFEQITGRKLYSDVEKFFNNIKQKTLFIRNNYGGNQTGWETLLTDIENYGVVVSEIAKKTQDAQLVIDATFGRTGSELQTIEGAAKTINDYFDKQVEAIKNESLSLSEVENKLNRIEIARHEALRDQYTALDRSDLANKEQEEIDRLKNYVVGWGEIVNRVLKDTYNIERRSAGVGAYFVTQDTRQTEYLKDLRKDYEDITAQVKDLDAVYRSAQRDFSQGIIGEAGRNKAKKDLDDAKLLKKAIEDIAVALGISLEKEKKGGRTEKDPRITALEREAAMLRDVMQLYDRYTDLRAIPDEDSLKILSNIYGEKFGLPDGELLNFETILNRIISDLDKLGGDGKKAADSVRSSFSRLLGRDEGNDVLASLRAYQKFQQDMKELLDKDYGISGEDVGFKLSRIALGVLNSRTEDSNDYEKWVREIEKLRPYIEADAKANGKAFGDAEWEAYKNAALSRLKELYTQKGEYDRKSAQESINNLGKEYVKDRFFDLFSKENPLTDWGDKSLKQIREMSVKIQGLIDDGLNLGENNDVILNQLKEAGLDLEKLKAIINEILINAKGETDQEYFKKLSGYIKDAAGLVGNIATGFRRVAKEVDGIGLDFMADTLDSINETITSVSSIIDNAIKGNYGAAILGVVDTVLNSIFRVIAAAKGAEKEAREAAESYSSMLQEFRLSAGKGGIFGDDDLKSLRAAYDEVRRLNADYTSFLSESNKNIWVGEWSGFVYSIRLGGQSLEELARKQGQALYDAQGKLRTEALKAIRDNYDILNASEKKWIDDAIKNIDEYETALMSLDSTLANLNDSIVDNVVSGILNVWAQGRDAVWEYNDALNQVVDSYIALAMRSAILDTVFNDQMRNDLKNVMARGIETGDFDSVLSLLQQGLDDVSSLQDSLFVPLRELYNKYHTFSEEDSADTLANGIKGVTEDTANLIASYLNAIRADVSYNKLQISGIGNDLKVLLGLVPQTNSLEFYLQQLTAHSQNTAANTAGILAELRSVITSENGPASVRTFNS